VYRRLTAGVDGVEASSVSGRVRAKLDPESIGLGRDDAGRRVATQTRQYRTVLVRVSHL